MNLEFSANRATLKRVMFEGTAEQPVDNDFVLPDYCPDISRMLKCSTEAKIISKTLNKNILTINGAVELKLIYLGNESCQIQSFGSSIGFTKEIELENEPCNAFVCVKAGSEYLNCRAVSGRKMSLHGAVSIHYTLTDNEATDIFCGISGNGVQIKQCKAENTAKIVIGEKNIVISEDIEVPQSSASVRSLIRGDAVASVSECKAVGDKAIIKGELEIKMLYDDNNSELSKLETKLPFSQILDVKETGEDEKIFSKISVSSLELRPKVGFDGEAKIIGISAVLCASVICVRNETVSYISDIYSTEYELNTNYKNVVFKKMTDDYNEIFTVSRTVDFPENIVSVADMWCEVKNDSIKPTENGIEAFGTITTYIIAVNSEKVPVFLEKQIEYSHIFKSSSNADSFAEINVEVESSGYKINSASTVEVNAQIKGYISVYESKTAEILSKAVIEDNAEKKKRSDASLVIYYAKGGEQLWDIARKYNTGVRQIMDANSLENDFVEKDMPLLLPIIR